MIKVNNPKKNPGDKVNNPEEKPLNTGEEIKAEGQNQIPAEISKEELEQIIDSVNTLIKGKEEAEQQLLRMAADFDNFRKRTRQEREDIVRNANHQMMLALLPIVDNFERAVSLEDSSPYAEGVKMIYRQLIMVLNQEGLEKIQSIGLPFDPNLHEAILQDEVAGEEKGKILEEIQSGYLFKGKLLRPTRVKVGV